MDSDLYGDCLNCFHCMCSNKEFLGEGGLHYRKHLGREDCGEKLLYQVSYYLWWWEKLYFHFWNLKYAFAVEDCIKHKKLYRIVVDTKIFLPHWPVFDDRQFWNSCFNIIVLFAGLAECKDCGKWFINLPQVFPQDSVGLVHIDYGRNL